MQIIQTLGLIFLNPLTTFACLAATGLVWGIQAAFGANIGYRRNLEWQTGFILGLLLSGLVVSLLYSVRPLNSGRTGTINTPHWLDTVAKYPTIIISSVTSLLGAIMFIHSNLAPVFVAPADWSIYLGWGLVFSVIAFACFICLGGKLGKQWFDLRAEPIKHGTEVPK